MCGIVGLAARRDVVEDLIQGLRSLEYRGYDSAGIAVLDDGRIERRRALGKVQMLADLTAREAIQGFCGIAHTRWATHGAPSEANAHPHQSGDVVLVHNGIIENHERLRAELGDAFQYSSQTDTEAVVHLIERGHRHGASLVEAVLASVARVEGAYAFVLMSAREPGVLIGTRRGSPLVVGLGDDENYLASDPHALIGLTKRFIQLEDGDVARVAADGVQIVDAAGHAVERPVRISTLNPGAIDRGPWRHFMQKEIHEQPQAIADTLEGRIAGGRVLPGILGVDQQELLAGVEAVHIIACGTSFHAGLVARYWIESLAGLPCTAEIASEYRYRSPVVRDGTLFIAISQSGETADTLAALRMAGELGYRARLGICNVPESSLVRESDLALMTRAGPEIGVASTKAFTTQLAALALVTLELARVRGVPAERLRSLVSELERLPATLNEVLELDDAIARLATMFVNHDHALFLGRGAHYPIAMEGALKLKEISYIHAEAYAAGELKHGPLALVDADMPVVVVAPNDHLLDKLRANMEEVRARGGELFAFVDRDVAHGMPASHVIELPAAGMLAAPIVMTVPLQLLAYHVAVGRGTDVDQPRNLAKSVTVE